MPVGRMSRHTLQTLRQELREKIVYAQDLQEGSGSPTRVSIGLSPAWQLQDGADTNVLGDIKLPVDRVPGTPIDIKLVIAGNVGGGALNTVYLYVGYLVASEGVDLTTAVTQLPGFLVVMPAPNLQKTTDPLRIAASSLDGRDPSVDIQFSVYREESVAEDNYAGNVLLLKVIFEYTAYV